MSRARDRRMTLGRLLDEAFRGPAWHGPSLTSSLRGVSRDTADFRPAPGRHSIRELVLHTALVKHRMTGRLLGARGSRFPRPVEREWWPTPGDATEDGWAADVEILLRAHERLLDTLVQTPLDRLAVTRAGRTHTIAEEVEGAALHDVYHAGQIALIRRIAEER